MYWEEDIETMSRKKLEDLQLARLRESVKKASASVFYGDLFRKAGIEPNEIRSLDDIRKIPFTTKNDLREHWPYGFLLSPKINW